MKNITDRTRCRSCNSLICRSKKVDCYGVKEHSLDYYQQTEGVLDMAHSASKLVDDGRAGTMGRVDEVIEYCTRQGYRRIGVGYCFGIKELAMELCETLEAHDLVALPVSCTAGAVMEREIDESKTIETVSCNPAGQQKVLQHANVDLVVELGLCLGHDIIFHSDLPAPHTVLMVKDRVYNHNPMRALKSYKDDATRFVESLDDSFNMKSPDWLIERMKEPDLQIVDLRGAGAYRNGHLQGAINILLRDLPDKVDTLNSAKTTVCVCNGSVQSAYAIMFLFQRGFADVHNLSGGMGRWDKEERPVVSQSKI